MSIVYDGVMFNLVIGQINFALDTFAVQLVGAEYMPDQAEHRTRGDIVDLVGTPAAIAITAKFEPSEHWVEIGLGGHVWPGRFGNRARRYLLQSAPSPSGGGRIDLLCR